MTRTVTVLLCTVVAKPAVTLAQRATRVAVSGIAGLHPPEVTSSGATLARARNDVV
ncbi:MAG: hypothetical protein H0U03_11280, partial [Actinobacteria bacterium]|nr:hypothetical protein [Actinomycetota bacterium]